MAEIKDDVPTIHQALAKVLGELPAIGKNSRNQQQGFNFRGIDDVLDALNPLLAKYGVFYVPDVIERIDSSRQTAKGGTLWVVSLHVRYTFYGPRGDSVVGSAWGEGTDSGDKATPKAMTGAMKYMLFQVFAIATSEQSANDGDHTSPEETFSEPVATQIQVQEIIDRLEKLLPAPGYPPDWKAAALPNIVTLKRTLGGEFVLPLAQYEQMVKILEQVA